MPWAPPAVRSTGYRLPTAQARDLGCRFLAENLMADDPEVELRQ